MDTNTIVMIIVVALVLLVVGGFLGVLFVRRQRTKRLQNKFGAEYDRAVDQVGDRSEAEDELEARVEHVESLDIQPLSEEQKEHFVREWQTAQAKFVDEPIVAIQEADQLIKEIMEAKNYPVDNFEQRAADISVDYPDLVVNYRDMRDIVSRSQHEEISTEDMRQAMIHCRALIEELIGTKVNEYTNQKEKIA